MPRQVEVEGIKQLSRQLKALDRDLLQELKDINKEAADDVATAAKGLVPVLSGKLQGSIAASGLQSSSVVKAGKGLEYGGVIHFGWARHNIEPVPFLYDALDERRDEVLEAYTKQLQRLIDKVT